MQPIDSANLKSILHSKRANLYYLEHCRVLVNAGRVEYVTEEGKRQNYWNIPIANTTTVLLGTGTSISQAAVRELAKAGVQIGFCSGGGTPLFAGTEAQHDIEWMSSQSEYRPTEYLQGWVSWWFDDELRLNAAITFLERRIELIQNHWAKFKRRESFDFDAPQLENAINAFQLSIANATSTTHLLTAEAALAKRLYKLAANAVTYGDFTRSKQGEGADLANRNLDYGNYLAYGLGATAAWVLGIPYGMAVLHGKTRRGGLVFDLADLFKDAIVLPLAFICAGQNVEDQQYRQAVLKAFTDSEILDSTIETLKAVALTNGGKS